MTFIILITILLRYTVGYLVKSQIGRDLNPVAEHFDEYFSALQINSTDLPMRQIHIPIFVVIETAFPLS